MRSNQSRNGTRLPARYFVWGVVAIWVVVAVLTHTGLLPAEVVERHALGGAEGLLLIQLTTYSFLTPPGMSPFWTVVLLAFSAAWLLGLAENASDWLDGWGFTRLYALATLGVGLVCWLAARALGSEDAVFYGAFPVLGVMIGAVTAYAPSRTGYLWGDAVRERLTTPGKGAAVWWLLIVAAALYMAWPVDGLFRLAPGLRGILLSALLLSWPVWPLLALKRMSMRSVCAWWCVWRGLAVVHSGLWQESFPVTQLLDAGLPLLAGFGYGLIARQVHKR